ncbi:hypothetical protein ABW20_dc0100025 [Dactylellina cionopaga]|nr:hypothetical protein ABW20_dc0100025 [Dactylellina cionopaga]
MVQLSNHVAHEGHDHSMMDHSSMNHGSSNHSSMTHSGHNHAEMMAGSHSAMCKMDMYWNWYTIDACFLSKSWHITSAAMFAGSCIGIVFLVVLVEGLRRCARELDRYIVRDWKKRALAAAEGVNVNVVGDRLAVSATTTNDAAATTTVPANRCCGRTTEDTANSSSTSTEDVTKFVAATTAAKPTNPSNRKLPFLARFCPYPLKASSSNSTPRPTIFQHLLKSLIYVVLIGIGYILMLLAMYYNGYVFFCLVIGAWLGNFLFGWDTCVLDESVAATGEGRCGC